MFGKKKNAKLAEQQNLKYAKVFSYNGTSWVVNGYWSASDKYPRRPGPKQAKEEGYPLDTLGVAHVGETNQAGWFVFPTKKINGLALAPLVLDRVRRESLPWRGEFRLGDGWWIVGLTQDLSLHPLWDVWVSDAEYAAFAAANAARWMTFHETHQTRSEAETWEWLTQDGGTRRVKVSPILGTRILLRNLAIVLALLAGFSAAVAVGMHWWKQHEVDLRNAKMLQRERMTAEQFRKSQRMTLSRQNAMLAHLHAQWASIPQPWEHSISWPTFLTACATWHASGNIDGWQITSVECSVSKSPLRLSVIRQYRRGMLATVLQRPSGVLGKEGNTVTQSSSLPLPKAEASSSYPLLQIGTERNRWMGIEQTWARVGVLGVRYSGILPMVAPVPTNIPPAIRAKLHPPILWRWITVTLSSPLAPDHWLPFLDRQKNFIPQSLSVQVGKPVNGLSGGGIPLFILKGVQYGR